MTMTKNMVTETMTIVQMNEKDSRTRGQGNTSEINFTQVLAFVILLLLLLPLLFFLLSSSCPSFFQDRTGGRNGMSWNNGFTFTQVTAFSRPPSPALSPAPAPAPASDPDPDPANMSWVKQVKKIGYKTR